MQEQRIIKRINDHITLLNSVFEENILRPKVLFDLKETSNILAETIFFRDGKNFHTFRFNKRFMEKNFDVFLNDVVAHEVAHLAVEKMFPLDNVRRKAHGKNFKLLVRYLGGEQLGAYISL